MPTVQELNAKAESKFNRLKTQAKNKIAGLNREVERLKEEKGGGATAEDSVNTSSYLSVSVSELVGGGVADSYD